MHCKRGQVNTEANSEQDPGILEGRQHSFIHRLHKIWSYIFDPAAPQINKLMFLKVRRRKAH